MDTALVPAAMLWRLEKEIDSPHGFGIYSVQFVYLYTGYKTLPLLGTMLVLLQQPFPANTCMGRHERRWPRKLIVTVAVVNLQSYLFVPVARRQRDPGSHRLLEHTPQRRTDAFEFLACPPVPSIAILH